MLILIYYCLENTNGRFSQICIYTVAIFLEIKSNSGSGLYFLSAWSELTHFENIVMTGFTESQPVYADTTMSRCIPSSTIFILFVFSQNQDEKNQMMITNVWVKHVSPIKMTQRFCVWMIYCICSVICSHWVSIGLFPPGVEWLQALLESKGIRECHLHAHPIPSNLETRYSSLQQVCNVLMLSMHAKYILWNMS